MTPKQPSEFHSNRKPWNRLLYDCGDAALIRLSNRLRGTVYDLGCGDLPYREWMLQYVDRYVGVDWSNTIHELKADVVADLNEPLPIDSGAADTVVSFSVLEHLREPETMLREAFRILKPGGTIVLQVPFMWWVHEAPHDYYRFTRFGLEHLFHKAGFVEIDVQANTGFWVMWVTKLNYQSRRLIRGPGPVRALTQGVLRLVWRLGGDFARWLDRRWKCEEETAGYTVSARRP
jgi:SAM-dependent methyltransferase